MKISPLFLPVITACLLLGSVGCSRQEDKNFDSEPSGQIRLVLRNVQGELLVQVENGSAKSISLADESLIGFGQGGSRVELAIYDNGERILPCANMDPLRHKRSPTIIESGKATTKTVSMDLVRKIYCLEPGRYELVAIYSPSATKQIASQEIVVRVKGDAKE